MTDDEQAQAVMEGLAGMRICPDCGYPMVRARLQGVGIDRTAFYHYWMCTNPTRLIGILGCYERDTPR